MPRKRTRTVRQGASNDARKLERLIRDSVRSEIDAQQSRRRTIDSYTQRLQETDAKVIEFIQQAISETTRAYRFTVDSYVANHVLAFFVLIAGLALIFVVGPKSEFFLLALMLAASGAIWVITLQYHSPVKNSNHMVNRLAKLNIIFAGYIRQIRQVDSVFEEFLDNDEDLDPQMAEQLLNNLQDAVSEAMNMVSLASNEMDD